VLAPLDRVSEALFGLIMVLTFTCSISAAEAGREDIRTMLIGALGCNLAWALIDATMYLMARVSDRGEGIGALQRLRNAADAATGRRLLAETLPPKVAAVMEPAELERVRERLVALPASADRPRLAATDWLGALAVFLWVFLITFPVALPFLFLDDARRAFRVSNGIAIALLFLAGYAFGRRSGLRPWRTGVLMVVFGAVLVAVAIALGG
jgi:VIT1/CCC1 family predicted Fe2+/Mn2+ transporter